MSVRYKSIIAVEQDRADTRVNVYTFEILSGDWNFNLIAAIKKASQEFLGTDEGRIACDDAGGFFDWNIAFETLPNAICEKYGFRKIESGIDIEYETRPGDEMLACGEYNENGEWVVYDPEV